MPIGYASKRVKFSIKNESGSSINNLCCARVYATIHNDG